MECMANLGVHACTLTLTEHKQFKQESLLFYTLYKYSNHCQQCGWPLCCSIRVFAIIHIAPMSFWQTAETLNMYSSNDEQRSAVAANMNDRQSI